MNSINNIIRIVVYVCAGFILAFGLLLGCGLSVGLFTRDFLGGGFMLVMPQDCMGITVLLEGQVQDVDGMPIADARIQIESDGSFTRPYNIRLISDENGEFDHPEGQFMYECETIHVSVSAEGFESVRYEAPIYEVGYNPLEIITLER